MSIGINWAEVWGPVWGPVWSTTPPATVPDVTGLDQATATATLEAAGFVVTVTTESSSAVATGLVIRQQPAGGESAFAGSTVTIAVSTGDAGTDPLDKKLLARPNVRIKGLRREKQEDGPTESAPQPALVEAEDEPPAPRPLAKGLDPTMLPEPPPAKAAPVKVAPVKAAPVKVAPAASPSASVPAPPAVLVSPAVGTATAETAAAPIAAPAIDATMIVAGLQKIVDQQAQQIEAQLTRLSQMTTAMENATDELRNLRAEQKIRDQKARNLERAAEITRKLLDN